MLVAVPKAHSRNIGATGGLHHGLGEADSRVPAGDQPSNAQQAESKAHGGDPICEFDAPGTELGKEARVWKIYVKESDRWDSELVDGWNKSLDVILVFEHQAALFSAISTAFLIESSKSLRKDGGDSTIHALFLISQTFLERPNNQTLGSHSWPDFRTELESTASSPPYTDVLINALWFLSLSLSVLTSFLAMLAKDWCHSFITGRTGHPYLQTRRRQQKWMMIEKWKMQELMTVLPSVLHLSLLLFAIGLCIYVGKLSMPAALPVVCVAALAVAFYTWSSIMATLVEFFPYTTVVSRILLSDEAKICYQTIMSQLQRTQPVVKYVSDLGAKCILPILDFLYRHIRWPRSWRGFLRERRDSLRKWAGNLYLVPAPERTNLVGSEEDRITSLALSWLISYCEVPLAVDAALQAISGASHLKREPLEECNASLEISRRLVSEDIYTQDDNPRVSLYSRALSYLNAMPEEKQDKSPGELEVLIWRLQDINNNRVASLITDGKFMPTSKNFDALRIGCTSASHVLERLNGGGLSGSSTLTRLIGLWNGFIEDQQTLHPAAFLALLNAGFLLSTCFPDSIELDITNLAVKLLHDRLKIPGKVAIEPQLGISLVAYIVLKAELALSEYSPQHNSRYFETSLHQVAKRLSQWSQSPQFDKEIIWLGVSVISSNPTEFTCDGLSEELRDLQDWATTSYHSALECLPIQRDHLINHAAVLEYLETLDEMSSPVTVGTPTPQIYYFVVESMCRDLTSGYDIWKAGGKLLSKFCFPKLSAGLIDWLGNEERSIIPLLWRSLDHRKHTIRFLAAAQLWHLFTLCSDSSVETRSERARLEARLNQYPSARVQMVGIRRNELLLRINEWWEDEQLEIHKWLGFYAFRVLECLLEATNHPYICTKQREIENNLQGVSFGLRGLGSFMRPESPSRSRVLHEPSHSRVFVEMGYEEGSETV